MFVRTFFAFTHSHVNYTTWESKKTPAIATNDNRLEKLTNRHWNLKNKTKQKKTATTKTTEKNYRFCCKTEVFRVLFFKTPFPFVYFRLILISMCVCVCGGHNIWKKSKCMKQGQIWCAAQNWKTHAKQFNEQMWNVCVPSRPDSLFIDLIFCFCLKSLWKAEKCGGFFLWLFLGMNTFVTRFHWNVCK